MELERHSLSKKDIAQEAELATGWEVSHVGLGLNVLKVYICLDASIVQVKGMAV